MADVKTLNGYTIKDAYALRNKTTAGTGTFIDNRAGVTAHPTSGANLTNSIIIGDAARFTNEGSSYSFVTVFGAQASALTSYTTAFGAQSVASAQYALACGYAAHATALNSTAYGYSAQATAQNAAAFGSTARATATNATALGTNARATAANAIQIGLGTNNNAGTVQIKGWQLLDASGYISEERLPLGLRATGVNPTNLYFWDLDESQVSEQVFLYTGDTNSFLTKDMYYRGAIWNSHPVFEITGVDGGTLKSISDVKIDQQKLFVKLAAVSKDRIDNDNIANSIVGGNNSTQSVVFGYNETTHLWFIYFEETGFESVYKTVPAEIEDITETELENDYGVYINKENFVHVAGSNDVFYVNYNAPNYCTGLGYSEADFTINYMKFMTAMCSNVHGFGYAIPNMETWSYVVDGTTYRMPVIPDEYNDVTVRFEWDGQQTWRILINGDDTGDAATTDLMAEEFGINIDATYEQDISYIELTFEPAKQRRWEQFVPATAGNGITLDGGVISLENDVVTDVRIHNVSKVVNKVANLSVAEQVTEFPTVTLDNTGLIVQYIGNTTSSLVHGYFYESIIVLQTATTTTYGIRIGDQALFANFLKHDTESAGKDVSYFTVHRQSEDNTIRVRCYSTDGPFSTIHTYTDNTFSTTGLTADESIGSAIATFRVRFGWQQINTQPGGASYTAGDGIDITNGIISADKTTIIGWGMPDYDAGVSISTAVGNTFTMPVDAYIFARCGDRSRIAVRKDNSSGTQLTYLESAGSDTSSDHMFVEKGTVLYIEYRNGSYAELYYFPLKGA